MRERIVSLANEGLKHELGLGDNVEWGIGPDAEKTTDELLDAIDRGNYEGGSSGRTFLSLRFAVPCSYLSRNVDH